MSSQQNIVFSFFCSRGYEVQSLILVRSLREFGGELSNLPVWIFVPEGQSLDSQKEQALLDFGTQIIPFRIDETFRKFPFALKAVAAARAEKFAEKNDKTLAWHDRTGMIRHAPYAFNLPEDKDFGFRPTDIANIGALFGQPLPIFWQRICEYFNISIDQLPEIKTIIDRVRLHLYVNAGLLVVRPEKNILRKWAKHFHEIYALPEFKKFYKEDQRYAIFIHQAALTVAVVEQTEPEERMILPENYLFSVDNYLEYPLELKINSLDEIITGRFHDFFALDNWEDLIIASEELIDWFKKQLQEGPYWTIQ